MKNDDLSATDEDQIFSHLEEYQALTKEIQETDVAETAKAKSWLLSFQQQGKRDPNKPTRRGKHVRHLAH